MVFSVISECSGRSLGPAAALARPGNYGAVLGIRESSPLRCMNDAPGSIEGTVVIGPRSVLTDQVPSPLSPTGKGFGCSMIGRHPLHLGFKRARGYLPPSIKERVTGATWHSAMGKGWVDQDWWDLATRYEQICRYVGRARLAHWVSIDDDPAGWPAEAMNHLVCCDGHFGLAQPGRVALLRKHLSGTN